MAIIEHSGYYYDPLSAVSHEHTSCELMYILEGKLEISAGDVLHEISENTLVLIKSRQHHKVRFIGEGGYRRYIGMINPWELRKQLVRPDLFALLTDTSGEGIIIVPDVPDLVREFERMTVIFNNGASIYSELSAALEIISVIYGKAKTTDTSESSAVTLTQRVRDYIEKSFADDIRIADIAKDNFISPSYLTHVFKSETGMSPREYLSHIRCTRAYELIRHTGMKFTAISAATGFCCANDMSRKIREYYELTPSEIRAGR